MVNLYHFIRTWRKSACFWFLSLGPFFRKIDLYVFIFLKGGARGGLERDIAPCRNMLAPRRKVKNYFVGDFWHLKYPESRILAPHRKSQPPCRKIPGATPDFPMFLLVGFYCMASFIITSSVERSGKEF